MAAVAAASKSKRTISRAAREAGVNVETIRYYERLGLIARPRAASGYRIYPEETVRRLQFIKSAKRLGFSLKEIAELAGMARAGVTCEQMCSRVEDKLRDIDTQVRRLTALRNELAGLIDCSPKVGSFEECKVYGMLEGAIPKAAMDHC
jgi:MerR family mercuric resistance operon transcriptional regulator